MLIAYYDLAVSPPTYDIVAFLLAIERERLKRKEDHVILTVLPGPVGGFRRDNLWPYNVEERRRMLDKVALPMCRMLPNTTVQVTGDRPNYQDIRFANGQPIGFLSNLYGTKLFVECIQQGIRPLRVSDYLIDPELVTITLREAEHWPSRNSNVSEWSKAAREISKLGYRVVIVRDTLCAELPLEDLETANFISYDLKARASLYRSSVCNLFVNNGPAWFAMALDAPVLMLKPVVDGVMNTCSTRFFESCGIKRGCSITGAPEYQQIVWEDDTVDNIMRAFQEYMNRRT